jgi:hypothetical protein
MTGDLTMAFAHVDPQEKAKLVYKTEQEAKEHKPEGKAKHRVFQVTCPNHPPRFVWEASSWNALRVVAVADGYVASSLGALPTLTKARAMLVALSPEDRAAVLAELSGDKPKARGK